MSTRSKIVDLFKKHRSCIRIGDIAVELDMTLEELVILIGSEDRLDDLCDLSVKQAAELIQFYGSRFLFSGRMQEHIDDYHEGE